MRVLVACEESQTVCKAFRARGHEAFSCDIQKCSGGHPEWHIHDDVMSHLNDGWDLMVGHPPCTYIANAGQSNKSKPGMWDLREAKTAEAIEFAKALYYCNIPRVAIENPIGVMNTRWRRPDQVVQPFYFGDPYRKYTGLWLKGLPKLVWTRQDDLFHQSSYVPPMEPTHTMVRKGSYRTGTIRKLYWQDMLPKKDRAKIKSKTFDGIARAMAEQWG